MKQKLIGVFLSTLATIACASPALGVHWQEPQRETKDLPVREELNRKFQFTGFGHVEVSGVAGDVNVETHDGQTVEVYVMRSAETQAELDCYQTDIDNSQDRVTIRHQQSGQGKCNSIRARQRVRLRVPHAVHLSLKTIGGAVYVARIDGVLRLQAIAGHATAAQVREAKIDGLAQGLTMSIAQPAARGISVSGVVGQVDLDLPSDLNADLSISSLISVDNKTPGVTITKVNAGSGNTRFGTGGPPITISGIVGGVRINP